MLHHEHQHSGDLRKTKKPNQHLHSNASAQMLLASEWCRLLLTSSSRNTFLLLRNNRSSASEKKENREDERKIALFTQQQRRITIWPYHNLIDYCFYSLTVRLNCLYLIIGFVSLVNLLHNSLVKT